MIRRPPRSTPKPSSAASDVYKRQVLFAILIAAILDLAAGCRGLHFCTQIALQRVLAAGSVPPQCVPRTTIAHGSAAVASATTKSSKSQGTQAGASVTTFLHSAHHRVKLASGTSARRIVTVHGGDMSSGDAPGGGRVWPPRPNGNLFIFTRFYKGLSPYLGKDSIVHFPNGF